MDSNQTTDLIDKHSLKKGRRKPRQHVQGARWRKLDNTAKLMAAVSGEDLSNVFRVCVVLRQEVKPEILERALTDTLMEFPTFRVRLHRGFFWNYFETNNREPFVESESEIPCRYIDPHGSSNYLFRVSYFKRRINLEVFHVLTDGMGAVQFLVHLTERYLVLAKISPEDGISNGERDFGGAGVKEAANDGEAAHAGTKSGGTADTQESQNVQGSGSIDRPQNAEGSASIDRPQNAEGSASMGRPQHVEWTANIQEREYRGTGTVREPESVAEEASPERIIHAGNRAVEEESRPGAEPDEYSEREREDGYLKHYKKQKSRHYGTERAMALTGERLPLGTPNIVHGYVNLASLKRLCREEGVSITKYLAALLLWSLIEVYEKQPDLERPVALNLPINLRSFFESETMANFFAVTNISWPAGRRPRDFEEVLIETGRQMDEKIVKSRLEEIISYNVSNEKKWFVRIVPLFIKNVVMSRIFVRSSRAYTMTLSNLGPVKLRADLEKLVDNFSVLIGVSMRQPMKCAVVAFGDQLCISFASVFDDTLLWSYFFRFLKERGTEARLESNGVTDHANDRGTYPKISYEKGQARKLAGLFYLVLLTAAIVTGIVNFSTYAMINSLWSVIAIGGIAYAALTVRYSILRRASLAGILLVQSLGAQALLALIDCMTGFHGWSFNYAIPSVILFDVIAIVFLILVNRLNWQSYFMYQIAITIFSFLPLLFWATGLVTRPLMAVITAFLSAAVLMVTILLGDRSVKKELKRRFHF